MNALHLLTLRYLALLELLAIDAIVTFFWSHDCATYQSFMVEIRRAIQGNRNRCYWNMCQDALDTFNPATYLLEGDNEFVLDLVPFTYTMTIRIMNYLITYRQLCEHDFYELLNKVSDITEGYLSHSHHEFKQYPVNVKGKVARLYSERV